MNYPNSGNYDAMMVGAVDADELKEMFEDDACQRLIKENRIGMELDYDKGTVWVLRDDDEALLVAKEFVM